MMKTMTVLAGWALVAALPVQAARPVKKPAPTAARAAAPAQSPSTPEPRLRSEGASRVADWVAGSGDNHGLPYIIIDKQGAGAFLFDSEGKPLADAPVLIGIALGDEATPGIGAKSLAEIGPAEKTTPAGRFLAKFGVAAGKQKVLWVDYTTSVALHTIPSGNPKEKRRDRMLSPAIDDNRITFGCINVPKLFYAKVVPLFRRKGGYVYVTPDSKPIEEVFPRLRVQPFVNAAAS